MTRAALALAVALIACAPDASGDGKPDAAQAGGAAAAAPTWRGDVSYPGLPAIGVLFVLDDAEPRLIAARNMGFDGGPLERLRKDDSGASFRWSLNGDPYDCVLRRMDDGVLLGPCTSPGEPTFGVRMVPPGVDAPTGLTRQMLEMSSVQWVMVDSGTTRIRTAAANRERLLIVSVRAAVERARRDNSALFGDAARIPADVFLVGERAVLASVTGRPSGGWTDPMSATVAVVGLGENSYALRHELTHAISFNAWGPPHEGASWLGEGVATWIAGECSGSTIHDLARDLRDRGELVPLRALIEDFHEQNDLIAYLQSGSVIGWLLEAHGRDALQRAWAGGIDALRAAGYEIETLERDWLHFLERQPVAGPVDWESIRNGGCH